MTNARQIRRLIQLCFDNTIAALKKQKTKSTRNEANSLEQTTANFLTAFRYRIKTVHTSTLSGGLAYQLSPVLTPLAQLIKLQEDLIPKPLF